MYSSFYSYCRALNAEWNYEVFKDELAANLHLMWKTHFLRYEEEISFKTSHSSLLENYWALDSSNTQVKGLFSFPWSIGQTDLSVLPHILFSPFSSVGKTSTLNLLFELFLLSSPQIYSYYHWNGSSLVSHGKPTVKHFSKEFGPHRSEELSDRRYKLSNMFRVIWLEHRRLTFCDGRL